MIRSCGTLERVDYGTQRHLLMNCGSFSYFIFCFYRFWQFRSKLCRLIAIHHIPSSTLSIDFADSVRSVDGLLFFSYSLSYSPDLLKGFSNLDPKISCVYIASCRHDSWYGCFCNLCVRSVIWYEVIRSEPIGQSKHWVEVSRGVIYGVSGDFYNCRFVCNV